MYSVSTSFSNYLVNSVWLKAKHMLVVVYCITFMYCIIFRLKAWVFRFTVVVDCVKFLHWWNGMFTEIEPEVPCPCISSMNGINSVACDLQVVLWSKSYCIWFWPFSGSCNKKSSREWSKSVPTNSCSGASFWICTTAFVLMEPLSILTSTWPTYYV